MYICRYAHIYASTYTKAWFIPVSHHMFTTTVHTYTGIYMHIYVCTPTCRKHEVNLFLCTISTVRAMEGIPGVVFAIFRSQRVWVLLSCLLRASWTNQLPPVFNGVLLGQNKGKDGPTMVGEDLESLAVFILYVHSYLYPG